MGNSTTTLLENIAAPRGVERTDLTSVEGIRLNLLVLEDFMHSITQRILNDELPHNQELWLIDLLDALQTEKESLEAKLAEPIDNEDDPLIGWHLHLRSQSGFELKA